MEFNGIKVFLLSPWGQMPPMLHTYSVFSQPRSRNLGGSLSKTALRWSLTCDETENLELGFDSVVLGRALRK